MNRPLIITNNRDTISSMDQDVTSGMSHSMTEVLSDPSSPESNFDESELFQSTMTDDVTAQLAAAGPIGVAAAAAIATGRKRKRPHSFETNPSIRKRQQTRLLRKLKSTIDEYSTRVGQQAIILTCTPGKSNVSSSQYKVFGSQPLGNIIRNCKNIIMQELEAQLAAQTPQTAAERDNLHELPPLNIDGIPTPVDKMTQAQLRAFIPEMLKYSTGRSKPGWGKPEFRPTWWPEDVPWANVRSDVRSEETKKKVSWTHALRTIVRNCYHHHGRTDLLPEFTEDPQANRTYAQQTLLQTISNPDGTMSIVHVETGDHGNPQIVTLADGSQAQIVHAQALVPGLHSVQQVAPQSDVTNAAVTSNQQSVQSVDMSNMQQQAQANSLNATYAEASINPDGQLVLASSDLAGVVSIPVSMYPSMVSTLQQPSIQVINAIPQAAQFSISSSPPQQGTVNSITPKQEDGGGDTTNRIEVVTIDSSHNVIQTDELETGSES